jgi:hypothetical protein
VQPAPELRSQVVGSDPIALQWVAANGFGWACAIAAAAAMNFRIASHPLVGALVGAAQWWVIRKRLRRAGWWIAAAIVGWFAGLQLGVPRGFFAPDPYWSGIAGGTVAGLLQSAVLRGQVRRPAVWVAASLVSSLAAWVAGTVVGLSLYDLLPGDLEYTSGALAGGLVGGVVSVPVITRMFGRSGKAAEPVEKN